MSRATQNIWNINLKLASPRWGRRIKFNKKNKKCIYLIYVFICNSSEEPTHSFQSWRLEGVIISQWMPKKNKWEFCRCKLDHITLLSCWYRLARYRIIVRYLQFIWGNSVEKFKHIYIYSSKYEDFWKAYHRKVHSYVFDMLLHCLLIFSTSKKTK